MDKIRIGDTVRFSYNTTPRIYLIVNNRSDIGIMTQCVVEDIDDDTAVIHAQSDENARLVIPTKYLIKVEAEAKEPKFKYQVGQKVKSVYADEILTIKEHCGHVGHDDDNMYRVEEYTYPWNECELKPYTEPTEQSKAKEEPCIGRINFAEREKRQQEAHRSIVNELRDKSFDWDAYIADLAKEIAVKMAGNTNFRDAQEKAAYVAKYVLEIVKNLNTTLSVKQVTNQY